MFPDSFLDKITPEPNTGCWLWTGTVNGDGYGAFWHGKKVARAHRAAYEIVNGPIPDGLEIDHLCRVRCCVNPDHLEAVTHLENMQRYVSPNSLLTHCLQGHPYSEENTYHKPDGGRGCRDCARLRMRKKRGSTVEGHWNRGKTHCIRGHELDGDNLHVFANGKRRCKQCAAINQRRRRARRTQEASERAMTKP